MKGPYKFNNNEISKQVTKMSAGNYALGYIETKKDGKHIFIVKYVGRSDSDVAGRLKQHIGENYSYFKYSYSTSPRDAFLKECENYHDFEGCVKLDNEIHPDRPKNTNWKCPYCDVFD